RASAPAPSSSATCRRGPSWLVSRHGESTRRSISSGACMADTSRVEIPLVNLRRQYQALAADVDRAVRDVCARADFVLGRAVDEFEQAYAAYLGVRHCIGVASGTDALHLILRALGIGAGDEVIVPANTFIATAQAVWCCGAAAVLVDCGETATMDPALAEAAITDRTKAILPVHLYGQPADLDPLLAVARTRGLH